MIDRVPYEYTKARKLNLSHNYLQCLDGISQFRSITNLNLSYNRIEDLDELFKVSNRENLVAISLEGNPCSKNPNLTMLLLLIFPKLKEVDSQKITPKVREDIIDSVNLSSKLLQYFYQTEQVLIKLDREVNSLKIKFELFQKLRKRINAQTGPYWEEVNSLHARELKRLVRVTPIGGALKIQQVRPQTIQNYIQESSSSLWNLYTESQPDKQELFRLYKWLFCEILLLLHNWGNQDLQCFLQCQAEKYSDLDDLQEHFEAELRQFFVLGLIEDKSGSLFLKKKTVYSADVFPDLQTDLSRKKSQYELFQSQLERVEGFDFWEKQTLDKFPVFGLYPEYLRALQSILETQFNKVVELQQEKEELLSYDTSVLGLPSVSDYRHTLAIRPAKELSSETSNVGVKSPQKRFRRKPVADFAVTEKPTMHFSPQKLPPISAESVKTPVQTTAQQTKQLQNTDQKLLEFYQIKAKKQKQLSVKKKVFGELLGLLKEKKLDFKAAEMQYKRTLWKAWVSQCHEPQVVDSIHNKQLLKKVLSALASNTLAMQNKTYKAQSYKKGKTLLDFFYKWKSFYLTSKKQKLTKLTKKKTSKTQIKQELEKLLQKINRSEKSIDKLWQTLKKKKKCLFCGNYSCRSCKQEKAQKLTKEISRIKKTLKVYKNKNLC